MAHELNRREFLSGTLSFGAALALPRLAEAHAGDPEYFSSILRPEELEKEILRSAEQMVADFWDQEEPREFIGNKYFQLRSRSEIVRALQKSSKSAIPTPDEIQDVIKRSVLVEGNKKTYPLNERAKKIPVGAYGWYVDGDKQKLYLLKKISQPHKVSFVKSIDLSSAKKGWGFEPESGKTPLGDHWIVEIRKGILGQVLSTLNPFREILPKIAIQSNGVTQKRTMVRGLRKSAEKLGEITTVALLLWGPRTPLSRGQYVHGTSHEDTVGAGTKDDPSDPESGGCLRVRNIDAYSLLGKDPNGVPYLEKASLSRDQKSVTGGTGITIFASDVSPIIKPTPESKSTSSGLPDGWMVLPKQNK